uniref:Uncharacterized protein n=1 Tax=Arundo donax TaxID=35708 RepID=A0A0A9E060_ARUDO
MRYSLIIVFVPSTDKLSLMLHERHTAILSIHCLMLQFIDNETQIYSSKRFEAFAAWNAAFAAHVFPEPPIPWMTTTPTSGQPSSPSMS